MGLESLITSPFFYAAVLITVYSIYTKLSRPSTLPSQVPWVELPDGWFPKIRVWLAGITDGPRLLHLAQQKYTSKGYTCLIPTLLGEGQVLLPMSQMDWVLKQPSNVLSLKKEVSTRFQIEYTLLDPLIDEDPLSHIVIKRELTRRVDTFLDDLILEAGRGFDEVWSRDSSDWHEVCLFETVQMVIARTSFAIFTWPSMCTNKDFLHHTIQYAHAVPLMGMVISLFPDFVKPLLGPIFTVPNRWHFWKSGKYVLPEIRRRIENHKSMNQDPEFKYEEPEDFITWHIRVAEQSGRPVEMTAEMVWKRIMSVGFASLHTTVFTATNAVLDLAASPPEQKCLEIIRAEVQQVLAEEGGKWTKRGLARMIHLDSAIRESMRLSGIVTRGLGRYVIAKGGVTTPGGIHLPEGASIAVASYGNRFDENMYDHSKNYDAFRYSRQRQTTNQGIEKSTQEILKSKHLAMISPADDFLQFGHSPHPCPGRFFAAAQLKVLLGCMVLNYDIKPLEKRPPGEWINDTILPPLKAKIWVKKRADGR